MTVYNTQSMQRNSFNYLFMNKTIYFIKNHGETADVLLYVVWDLMMAHNEYLNVYSLNYNIR